MPSGVHKNPLLGWRPPAGLSAWVRAEAERREVGVGVILTEAVTEYQLSRESRQAAQNVDVSAGAPASGE
jgi:hypothetical protein